MHSTRHRIAVLLLLSLGGTLLAAQAPAGATAKCKDGTYSTAKSSQGRCSNHGGVAQLLNTTSTSTSRSAPTTTKSTARTRTAAGGVPIGATFQCKDGSYSTAKTTTGACSRHGGVDHALGGAAAASPAPAPSRSASPAPAGGEPAGATFQCKDGSYSKARSAQGACSSHGGVDHALTAAPAAAPAPTTPAAAAGGSAASGKAPTVARPGDAPANATAKCRDGTYSASQQHSGSCSHHGGVAEWYQ
jgi:uncharacterized protein DUF3761